MISLPHIKHGFYHWYFNKFIVLQFFIEMNRLTFMYNFILHNRIHKNVSIEISIQILSY
jgi:hypothetical protein